MGEGRDYPIFSLVLFQDLYESCVYGTVLHAPSYAFDGGQALDASVLHGEQHGPNRDQEVHGLMGDRKGDPMHVPLSGQLVCVHQMHDHNDYSQLAQQSGDAREDGASMRRVAALHEPPRDE